jgi:hypothetical protein
VQSILAQEQGILPTKSEFTFGWGFPHKQQSSRERRGLENEFSAQAVLQGTAGGFRMLQIPRVSLQQIAAERQSRMNGGSIKKPSGQNRCEWRHFDAILPHTSPGY